MRRRCRADWPEIREGQLDDARRLIKKNGSTPSLPFPARRAQLHGKSHGPIGARRERQPVVHCNCGGRRHHERCVGAVGRGPGDREPQQKLRSRQRADHIDHRVGRGVLFNGPVARLTTFVSRRESSCRILLGRWRRSVITDRSAADVNRIPNNPRNRRRARCTGQRDFNSVHARVRIVLEPRTSRARGRDAVSKERDARIIRRLRVNRDPAVAGGHAQRCGPGQRVNRRIERTSTNRVENGRRVDRRVSGQPGVRQVDGELAKGTGVGRKVQRTGAVVWLAERADAHAGMRIYCGQSDRWSLLRQLVPPSHHRFRPVEQQRKRLRRAEWVG